jgi:hypothetical protein
MQMKKYVQTWDHIKHKYIQAPILIPPNWWLEFDVHIDASLLTVGEMLAQNPTSKYDQPMVYASRLLNKAEQNYTTIEKEALGMVYALHKFRFFLLGNKFVFYVDHMVLVYLVNKP